MKKFVSIEKFSRLGILSRYALRSMRDAGQLPMIQSGRRVLIDVDGLAEYLGEDPEKLKEALN